MVVAQGEMVMGQELEAIEITVTTKDCHTMYTAICDAIQHWPGSPARPAQEQEDLLQLKTFWFSILCEIAFEK